MDCLKYSNENVINKATPTFSFEETPTILWKWMQTCDPGKIPYLICTELFPLNSALEFQQMLVMSLIIFSFITSNI